MTATVATGTVSGTRRGSAAAALALILALRRGVTTVNADAADGVSPNAGTGTGEVEGEGGTGGRGGLTWNNNGLAEGLGVFGAAASTSSDTSKGGAGW